MYIRHLVPGLSVSEQIFPNQLAELKDAGLAYCRSGMR
jgi:sulfide:quinone oxidoreductase